MAQSIKESAYLLSIAFVVLGIIFLLLAFNSVPCIIKAFKRTYFFPKVFYIFMLITCIDQATYQIMYLYEVITAIQQGKDDESSTESFRTIFFQTIYIPDAIFFIVYFSLFWQFLIMMHNGRIQTGNILVGKSDWNPESANPIVRVILYAYIVGQSIVIWQFLVNGLSPKAIMVCDVVVNASVPFIVLIMILYLNVKFSGSPFVSNRYERSNHKIQQLLWIWIILRIPQLAVNVIVIIYDEELLKLFQGKLEVTLLEQLFLVFFIVGDVIIVQIVPLLMAMSNNFVRALLADHNRIQLLGSVETVMGEQHSSLQPTQTEQKKQKSLDLTAYQKLKLNNFIFEERQFYRRFNGFGEIKVAKITSDEKKQLFAMRIIQFKELSSFLIDETKQEIEQINSLQKGYKILWFQIEDSKMYILTKYYINQSLHHFIHSGQDKIANYSKAITISQINKALLVKIHIALELVESIRLLHDQGLVHGHLNSNNILFTKSYNIKIVDFGLRAIKKYSGLVNGYCNKSGFTAPECLGDRGNVVSQTASKDSDIYSYGMILYELFVGTIPFNNMPPKDICQLVKDQQNRPKIPEDIGSDLATLIRFCWQQDPEKRPKTDQIITTLKQISDNYD